MYKSDLQTVGTGKVSTFTNLVIIGTCNIEVEMLTYSVTNCDLFNVNLAIHHHHHHYHRPFQKHHLLVRLQSDPDPVGALMFSGNALFIETISHMSVQPPGGHFTIGTYGVCVARISVTTQSQNIGGILRPNPRIWVRFPTSVFTTKQ